LIPVRLRSGVELSDDSAIRVHCSKRLSYSVLDISRSLQSTLILTVRPSSSSFRLSSGILSLHLLSRRSGEFTVIGGSSFPPEVAGLCIQFDMWSLGEMRKIVTVCGGRWLGSALRDDRLRFVAAAPWPTDIGRPISRERLSVCASRLPSSQMRNVPRLAVKLLPDHRAYRPFVTVQWFAGLPRLLPLFLPPPVSLLTVGPRTPLSFLL
jgi:hypothetical protein